MNSIAAPLVMMLRLVMAAAILMMVIPLFLRSAHSGRDYAMTMTMTLGALGLSVLAQRGYVRAESLIWTALLFCGVSFALWMSGGFYSGVDYGYFLVIILASALLSRRATLVFDGLSFLSNTIFFLLSVDEQNYGTQPA